MKDTPEIIEQRYISMFKNISNSEKLKMGCSMFRLVSSLIISSLIEKGIKPEELKKHLFLRIYGNDFSKEEIEKILAKL